MARSNAWRKPFVTTVEDLSHDGRGVAKVDGKVVFIPGVLPGETVEVQRVRRSKKHETAKLLKLITPSEQRIAAKCQSFEVCGGCSLQHISASDQIQYKQQQLLENLQRIGNVVPKQVLEPLSADEWAYRRRARLGVRYVHKKNRVLIGFREKFSNYITDMPGCEVIDARVNQLLPDLVELISALECKREVPQIEVSAGDNMVALVFRHLVDLNDADSQQFTDFALKHADIQVYLQRGGLDTVTPLQKYPPLSYALGDDLELEFEPIDFVQVNAGLNKLMIRRALKFLQVHKNNKVLDLFCGLGNFTLPLAKQAGQVVGVEGDAGLVQRARDNARRNACDNVDFHVANLFEDFSQADWAKETYDLLLIDPPRAGAEQVVQTKGMFGVERIVYISCHPGSLARDAGHLVHQQGFTLSHAGVMDMFPHTGHVESIAVFERHV
ncbi:MAG: 23S rRNA (uracil(1939)-C(5))-methyltransferase RlmD [Gammaproteobacteria bacterium]|nr:23S rRNA (uracil(1939)-C(5))-methyltransferase RlmD [Gammaproteobacteria bacterium]NNC96559.1 23S rRNA (uracil(1939)-C(5))-methyltransferase RlmD [Gammaproteobacteria bacterium]NNM12918.1 23S rRNA (uracil(1939)-C(5))-methyltransferase RlmD [Gammaproteobacteria bacterium]